MYLKIEKMNKKKKYWRMLTRLSQRFEKSTKRQKNILFATETENNCIRRKSFISMLNE